MALLRLLPGDLSKRLFGSLVVTWWGLYPDHEFAECVYEQTMMGQILCYN